MSSARRFSALLGLVSCVTFVTAQASLYIPGFDPQPINAEVLGVGADGATTWLLQPGMPSGTLDDSGFEGEATLVEGPTSAYLNWIDPTAGVSLQENCVIANGIAVCQDNAAYISQTTLATVETEIASAFPVQVAAGTQSNTAAPTSDSDGASGQSSATSVATSGVAAATTSPIGSGMTTVVGGSKPSGSVTGGLNPSASGSQSTNGASGLHAVPLVALAAAGLAAFLA